jgi:S-formylglutathione hydrolase FrmB
LWQWPAVRWWRRAVALVAVPSLLAFAGLQVNAHYAYLPTLSDLFHGPLPGQVDARRLDALTSGVDASGRIVVMAAQTVSGGGVVAEIDIPAAVSGFRHRPAWVWLPPVYFRRPRPRLPVLVLFSGTPGGPEDWLRGGGALTLANDWASAHRGDAPIMVLPDVNGSTFGDTECVDGPRGRAETYLSVDLPAFMHNRFGVSTDPHRWAIAGFSEGGTCALTLVARHSSRFATFADFAGDTAPTLGSPDTTLRELYGGSRDRMARHDPTTWFAADAAAGVEGCIAVGARDPGHVAAELQIVDAARAAHLPLRFDVLAHDGHSFRAWKRALADAYAWLVLRLEPTAGAPIVLAGAHAPASGSARHHAPRILASDRPSKRKLTR